MNPNYRPSYSADWGDYISFGTRMREKAEADGADLLIIDTGDRIEGTGLYDSSDPKGLYTADILKQQHIDVLCSGNHELYKQNSSEDEFLITIPNFKGNYLSSNIDIFDPDSGDQVPLGPRFKKFTTKVQGIRITAFGFLFDFKGNYNNTVVHTVEKTIKEKWFQEAISDREVDLFLVIGHVPVHSKEYSAIFKEIRSHQWDTPIQFFGGHYHIRDYAKYDAKSYGLASGRFMETIGFMSIDGLSIGGKKSNAAAPSFNRRYIDNNLFSFHHHTGLNESTFPTPEGKAVSTEITKARESLDLNQIYGCSPGDLWMSRVKHTDKESIYSWLSEKVLPDTLQSKLRDNTAAIAIVNTGGIRFDIFKGPFTRDTAYMLSPFTNGFRYTKDIPYDAAVKILDVLNKQSKILSQFSSSDLEQTASLQSPEQLAIPRSFPAEVQGENIDHSDQIPLSSPDMHNGLTPGYTTKDDAGTDGDDTMHSPISFYNVPNCIQAFITALSESTPDLYTDSNGTSKLEKVDLIYLDFIEPWIDVAAKFVGIDFDVKKDTEVFMQGSSLRTVIVDWAERNWKCPADTWI